MKQSRLVFLSHCPSPPCDTMSSNCTRVVIPSNDQCSCLLCADI